MIPIEIGEAYYPTSPVQYTDKLYIDLSHFYPTSEFFYTDRILEHLNTYNVTAGDGGFDDGLVVGLMLSNSGLI